MSTLAIIIVNYRTPQLTIDCLRTIAAEIATLPPTLSVHVTITDNLSPDDSVPILTNAIADNHWSSWATLMPLPNNGGFSYGNNQAIKVALASPNPPDYLFLLNPDTLVRPNALQNLVSFLDQNPHVHIAGTRVENLDGTTRNSAFRFTTALGELESSAHFRLISKLLKSKAAAPAQAQQPHPIDWVSGAAMIVRRDVFEKIGLLDEKFFMYFEEQDFCLRAHNAGYSCWYVPSASIVHLVGQASGVTGANAKKRRIPTYWFNSRRYFFRRHYGFFGTLAADAAWSFGMAIDAILCLLNPKKTSGRATHAFFDNLRHAFAWRWGKS